MNVYFVERKEQVGDKYVVSELMLSMGDFKKLLGAEFETLYKRPKSIDDFMSKVGVIRNNSVITVTKSELERLQEGKITGRDLGGY